MRSGSRSSPKAARQSSGGSSFKFNSSKSFAGCEPASKNPGQKNPTMTATGNASFGGVVQTKPAFGQQFAFASSEDGALRQGSGCAGATLTDPIGATFDQVYNGSFHYLIWNDQFYHDPVGLGLQGRQLRRALGPLEGTARLERCGRRLRHAGLDAGVAALGQQPVRHAQGEQGQYARLQQLEQQSARQPALLCAQADQQRCLVEVLDGAEECERGDRSRPSLQIVQNGGPPDVRKLVDDSENGRTQGRASIIKTELSSGVIMISKPSGLACAALADGFVIADSEPTPAEHAQRTATWWTKPWIPTTTNSTAIRCWDDT